MRTGHIFAGAGGGILADLINGHEPAWAVEWDPYACQVLRERFPGLHVIEGDVRGVDFRRLAPVDALCGGFPCQDISLAGKGGGSPESEAASTVSSSGQSTIFDLPGCSWKIAQPSEPVADMSSSGTLWRQDIPGATASLERLMSARPTDEIAGGYLPTVTATTAKQGARSTWATPLASDWKSHSPAKKATNSRPLREQVGASDGGPLNPAWVEWLMGWPLNHTKTENFVMEKKSIPPKPCAHCGTMMERQRFNGRLEDASAFKRRKFCTLACAAHGLANRAHRIKCLGNGQVPLAAAVAWRLLGGPVT